MAAILPAYTCGPRHPADARDPAHWPEAMQAEWGTDEGKTRRPATARSLIAGFDRIRAELEAFDPEVILVWGDDQYENFKEDLIPPYAILAYPTARSGRTRRRPPRSSRATGTNRGSDHHQGSPRHRSLADVGTAR